MFVRKCEKRPLASSRFSLRLSLRNNLSPAGRIFLKFCIGGFTKIRREYSSAGKNRQYVIDIYAIDRFFTSWGTSWDRRKNWRPKHNNGRISTVTVLFRAEILTGLWQRTPCGRLVFFSGGRCVMCTHPGVMRRTKIFTIKICGWVTSGFPLLPGFDGYVTAWAMSDVISQDLVWDEDEFVSDVTTRVFVVLILYLY